MTGSEAMVASTDGFELAERISRPAAAPSSGRASRVSPTSARPDHARPRAARTACEAAQALPPGTMLSEVDALLGESEHLGAS